MRRAAVVLVLAAVSMGMAACSGSDDSLLVYSGRNESLIGPVLERFEAETGIEIDVRYAGTAELAAQIAEEEDGGSTPADVFIAQDAGALGAVAKLGLFSALGRDVLERVEPRFRSADGTWVGLSGRARVLVYDPRALSPEDLPDSVFELVDPQWRGRFGIAPMNASFQAFVTAMRVSAGEEATEEWLRGIAANDPVILPSNVPIVEAVDEGRLELGLVNHYYLYERIRERGAGAVIARNAAVEPGDPGNLVNVAGAGILAGTDRPEEALRLVEFLLGPEAQTYFAEETSEYPLVDGAEAPEGVPPLSQVQGPGIDLDDLDTLEQTLELLSRVGLL